MNRVAEFEHRYEDWPRVPCRIENPATGRWLRVELLVDTGADATILDRSLALSLGIDLESAAVVGIRGFGGRMEGYPAIVDVAPLYRSELKVRIEAVFVRDALGDIGNVLGLDYFALVDVTLSHANNLVRLSRAS